MRYSVIWIKDSVSAWESLRDMTAGDFDTRNTTLFSQGYRVICLNNYVDGTGVVRYAAEWVKNGLDVRHTRGLTAAQHGSEMNQLKNLGYRPVWVSGCNAGGQELLSAVYVKDGLGWQARDGADPQQHAHLVDQLKNQGFRPLCMSGYPAGNATAFASVWVQDPGQSVAWEAFWQEPAADLQNRFNQFSPQGFRPISISSYWVGADIRYTAVWVKGGPPFVAHFGVTSDQQIKLFNKLKSQGFRPVCTVGVDDGSAPVVAPGGSSHPADHAPSSAQLNQVGQALVEALSETFTVVPIGDQGSITADTVQYNQATNSIRFHVTIHYKQSGLPGFLGQVTGPLYDFTTFYEGDIDMTDPLGSIQQTRYGFNLPDIPGIGSKSVSLNAEQLYLLGQAVGAILAA